MTKTTGSIAASTNIVKESVVMGDVSIGEDSTILFYAVLRGDDNKIIIGKGTNIQDNCTVHTSKVDLTMVGDYVTVGHNAILHGCTIGDNTLIGMGATVMNGSVIGKNCLIAAGSLVLEHQNIPDGSMVMGRPAKVTRALTEEEIAGLKESALSYIEEGGHAGIDGRRNCRVKRECTFLYRRGKETQGRRLLLVKKRYTSG